MERYRVYDGTHYRSICGCGFHVRDTAGNWKLVDPDNCDVRYYNEGTWKQIDCCYEPVLTTCNITASYCNSGKLLVEYVYPGICFNEKEYETHTCSELNTQECDGDIETDYRAFRDEFLKHQSENINALLVGLPAPWVLDYATLANYGAAYADTTYLKFKLKKAKITAWCPASTYPEWTVDDPGTGLSPDDVMPTVTDFTFLPSVNAVGDLPGSGSPGQIIYVRTPTETAYAWDPALSSWSTSFYNTYVDPIQTIREDGHKEAAKTFNNLILAIVPWIMATNSFTFHLLRKKTIEKPCL